MRSWRRSAPAAWERFTARVTRGSTATSPSRYWLPDGRALACVRTGSLEIVPVEPGEPRVVYTAAPGSADPRPAGIAVSEDGGTIYFKSHDADGRAMLWSIATTGGQSRLLVRFDGLSRPSIRSDFAAGAGQFFFTLEDRQTDIALAEVERPAR